MPITPASKVTATSIMTIIPNISFYPQMEEDAENKPLLMDKDKYVFIHSSMCLFIYLIFFNHYSSVILVSTKGSFKQEPHKGVDLDMYWIV